MKNLKKALVLVLAFAMVFSLFTFNASAASFADDEDIVNKEAVSTMSQLGVINGYEDGTFLPNQIVTRAEMCKMISVAMTGGNLPLLEGTSLFSDTAGHWANSYINYCYNKGIVSGDSGKGGTFRPDAPVTAIEAAKMMLVAIGYNSTLAGFTGPEWDINVASAASDKNLFNSIGTLNVSAGLSRDNAAQLIYNGIRADMVEYTSTLTTDPNGQLTSTPTLKNRPGVTMLTDRFGVSVLEGYIVSSEYATIGTANATNTAGETTMYVRTKGATTVNNTFTLKTSTPADMVGKAVKVYVKDSSLVGSTYNTVFGAPVVTSNNRVKTFTGAAYRTVSDFTTALKAAGINGFAAGTGVTTITNNGFTLTKGTYSEVTANALLGRGKEVTFIDNDSDGLVDVVKIMKKNVGEVTVYNTNGNGTIAVAARNGSIPTNALTSRAFDKVVGAEDVALKDYVLYYELGGKFYIEKAPTVTANVTSINPTSKTVTADGVTYYQSSLVDTVDSSNKLEEAVKLGKATTFYFDNYGNVINAKTVAAVEKYLIVTAVGTPDPLNGLQVKVVNEEGVVSVVYLDSITTAAGNKISTTGSSGADDGKDMEDALSGTHKGGAYNDAGPTYDPNWQANKDTTIFTYTVKDNGKYVLTAPATAVGVTATNINGITKNDPALGKASGDARYANANTVFVVKNGNTYSVYTGIANVPTVTDATTVSFKKDNSTAETIVFVTGGKVSGTSTGGVFICSTSYSSVLDGTNTVHEYPAIVDGVATTVTATSAIFKVGYYAAADLISNAKGQYTGIVDGKDAVEPSAITTVGNGVINGFTYDDDTKVFEISRTGAVTESSIANVFDGKNGTIASMAVIVGKAAPNDKVARYVFVTGQVAAPEADAVTLAQGSVNKPTIGNSNIKANTATVTDFAAGERDTVKITVTNPANTTSTITINGFAYTAGADYVLTGIGKYTVVVTTSKDGCADKATTYEFNVSAS